MFQKLLAALGLAPKNLDQARATYTEAKTFAESVNALFTAAAIPLEPLLAAGPDSLKAHIAALDNTTENTRLAGENTKQAEEIKRLQADLKDTQAKLETATARNNCFSEAFAAVGFADGTKIEPAAFKAKFEEHVKKAANLELGQRGHPPAHIPKQEAIDDVTPTKTDDDKAAAAALVEYEKLIAADNQVRTVASREAKAKFYAENHAKIDRALQLRRRN